MNRTVITLLLMCLLPFGLQAQEKNLQRKTDQERQTEKETIQAQKVAFITQETGLTTDEAEKFWPLYNEMEKKINDISHLRGRSKKNMYKALAPESVNKSSLNKDLGTYLNTFKDENQVRAEYHTRFLKVLSTEKVARFYLAEEHFSNKLFREYIEKKISERAEEK